MGTTEERLTVLHMLEEGKITAEEAASLLRALGEARQTGSRAPSTRGPARFLRVQVTDLGSGQNRVNITLPMGLLKAGLRMAERFAPDFDESDMQEIQEMISSGMTGKVLEVVDQEDNERIEIYVE